VQASMSEQRAPHPLGKTKQNHEPCCVPGGGSQPKGVPSVHRSVQDPVSLSR
jgi:hypothetical protein